MQKPTYVGPERRERRVLVTRNTEYHFLGSRCVAVRDLKSGRFLTAHLALHCRLSGGVRMGQNGCAVPTCSDPQIGEAIYFGEDGFELVTSKLCGIDRPGPEVIESYPEAAVA